VAERSPLFLGLVRPPKLLGLPIMYAMVWLFGSVLLFVMGCTGCFTQLVRLGLF
jgi:type IV secretory pathway VirB3-like protein